MALAEDIIFSDPVLQRIFFDGRRFAPKNAPQIPGEVCGLEMSNAEDMVLFLKAKKLPAAETIQQRMRARWFRIRRLSDGYLITWPAGYSDGCVHVVAFEHDNAASEFNVDKTMRRANWWRYERTHAPDAWRLGIR